MSCKSKSHLGGRDARTGQFIPIPEARSRPDSAVVERIPNPGRGDTGRGKKK